MAEFYRSARLGYGGMGDQMRFAKTGSWYKRKRSSVIAPFRRYKRRSRMVKRKFSKRRRAVGRMPRGIAAKCITKLTYGTFFEHDFANENVIDQTWNLNSVFDPDNSGGGHQPRWLDQYDTLYDKYEVHGCKIRLTIYPTEITAAQTVKFVRLSRGHEDAAKVDKNSIQDIIRIEEEPGIWRMLMTKQFAQKALVMSKYYNVKMLANMFNHNHADRVAETGANPAKLLLASMVIVNPGGLITETDSVKVYVKITYFVSFYDRKDIAVSNQ